MLRSVASTTLGLITKIRRWWSKWVQNCASYITLCVQHHFPLIRILRKGEHRRVLVFSSCLLFFLLLLLTVFGTLAAEFEVLVFACHNGDQKPKSVLLKFSRNFQVTSKCLYGFEWKKKALKEKKKWERTNPFCFCSGPFSVLQKGIRIQLWLTTKGLFYGNIHSFNWK